MYGVNRREKTMSQEGPTVSEFEPSLGPQIFTHGSGL